MQTSPGAKNGPAGTVPSTPEAARRLRHCAAGAEWADPAPFQPGGASGSYITLNSRG